MRKDLANNPEHAPKLAQLQAPLESGIQKTDRPFGAFKESAPSTPKPLRGKTRDTAEE